MSDELFEAVVDGKSIKFDSTFYRGEQTNYLPLAEGMQRGDGLARNVLAGWMPATPFIGPDTTVVAFGSCFAGHVSRYLANLGFDVGTRTDSRAYVSAMGDGIVNTYAVRQQFEWAWEGRVPPVPLWHGYKAEEFGYDEEVRLATRALFDRADVFIITFGLSEIWYDEPTGEVFWRAVPMARHDPARHRFRTATVAENCTNMAAIHGLIRHHRPDAAIVFTLSPIPLSATFRPVSPYTANAASKASLRSAIDEFMQAEAGDRNLFYYPAYEVVMNCFRHTFIEDLRHPHLHILNLNMKAFERYFCRTGLTDQDVEAAWLKALARDRELGNADSVNAAELIRADVQAFIDSNPPVTVQHDMVRKAMEAAVAERAERTAERVRLNAEARANRIAARTQRQGVVPDG